MKGQRNKKETVSCQTQAKYDYFSYLHRRFLRVPWGDLRTAPQWEKMPLFHGWFTRISKNYMNENDPLASIEDVVEILSPDKAAYAAALRELSNKLYQSERIGPSAFLPVRCYDSNEALHELDFYKNDGHAELPGYDALRVLRINLDYPKKVLLEEISKVIQEEQEHHYRKEPSVQGSFSKMQKDGRGDTYNTDEWPRYLEVYILKNKESRITYENVGVIITEKYGVYSKPYAPQVKKDYDKASALSQSALNGTFPKFT